ncbi:hypothetical protein [Exiguobacterium acetylicum]|uniref:hypothetical protein n=1 Tax=Exiguobacterium acetylicum TaxID=41170 RepID=UPI001CA78CEF|nr:hypothetical protein [Exiguobacterium acetylicum]QZY86401.1 hypothetical protein K7G97_14215 [Exiguobacterium acetylicum]
MYCSEEEKILIYTADDMIEEASEKILFKLNEGKPLTEIMRENSFGMIRFAFWIEPVSISASIISDENPELMLSFGSKSFDADYGATVDEILEVVEYYLLHKEKESEEKLYEMLKEKMTPHLEAGVLFPQSLIIRDFISSSLEDVSADYNSYMNGYYDGLEKALSILENRPANFYPKPDVWLEDLKGHTPADMKMELELEQRGFRLTIDGQIVPINYESDYTVDVTKEKD